MRARKVAISVLVAGGSLLVFLGLALARPARVARDTGSIAADDTTVLSAGLLRRLAAAADGYRTGEAVWVVASLSAPYTVAGVFADRRAAVAARRDGSRVFGPYITDRDFGTPPLFMPERHYRPTIYGMDPPFRRDSSWQPPHPPWFFDDIDSFALIAYHHSARPWRGVASGEVDAMFFTLSAYDKFVFPYYADLSGLRAALGMRDSLGAYIREAAPRPRRP